jgi:hypothetical protein
LYTSIDSTPLKDIFDLVGRGQYCYVGSVCKEWNTVYWQGDDHEWKMAMFWHNQQSSHECIELWLEDIDKNKLKKPGYNHQKLGNYQASLLMKQPVTRKSVRFEHKFFLCTLSNCCFMVADYLWAMRDKDYRKHNLFYDWAGKQDSMESCWCSALKYANIDILDWFMKHKLYKPNECNYIKVAIKEWGHVERNAWKREIDVTNPMLDWLWKHGWRPRGHINWLEVYGNHRAVKWMEAHGYTPWSFPTGR